MSSTSATRADQYASPSWSPAWRARRAFSPREAWKIEIDLDNEMVRSKNSGLWRAFLTASVRSSRLRSAVACGSAASSCAYRSAAFRPLSGAGRAGCRQGPCARRTAGHMARARSAGQARSRALSRPGPTTGPAVLPRSRWPGCSSRPRPWPGRGPPASRCSQGHSPCSASRQLPLSPAPPWRGRSRTDHDHLMMHGCDAAGGHGSRVTKRAIKIRNNRRSKRT